MRYLALVLAAALTGIAADTAVTAGDPAPPDAPAFADLDDDGVVGGGDITLKSRQGDVLFSHDLHVARVGAKCQQCHDSLYTNAVQHKSVTMRQMQEGKSCGACHNGKQAFSVKADCARCHKKQGRT